MFSSPSDGSHGRSHQEKRDSCRDKFAKSRVHAVGCGQFREEIENIALEVIQEALPRSLFLAFLGFLGKTEEQVFKKDDHKKNDLTRESIGDDFTKQVATFN
jgi:hypothetical protein